MKKIIKTTLTGGIASVATVVLLVAALQYNPLGDAILDESCLPTNLAAIPAKGFPIREPSAASIAPSAELRGIDQSKDLVTLYYADFSMCPFDETPHEMIQKGAVKVTIFKPQVTINDSSEFQSQELAYYTSNPEIIAKAQAIEVDGYKGIGWEPYEGKSIVRLNGEVIESTPVPEPGVVRYYNEQDGTIYFITANQSLVKILDIASTIQ